MTAVRRIAITLAALSAAWALAATALADGRRDLALPAEKSSPVRVAVVDAPPTIDGSLDDAAWKAATRLGDFYQTNPGDNIAPSLATEVLVCRDRRTLYVAFRAHDEAGKVRSSVAPRDDGLDDDYVGLYLDTFDDRRKAYALFFNPLGIQSDAVYTANGEYDFTIDIVMTSKGVVGQDGYVVEVAIPFKSLKFSSGDSALWGANFVRSTKRFDNETDAWMPYRRDTPGLLNQLGRLTGFGGVEVTHTLEVIPSLTVSESGRRVPAAPLTAPADPGRIVNAPLRADLGVTVNYAVTSTVTANLAINPDFAQVEADQILVTANQRFPLFYDEKRPFFLDNAEVFKTPLSLVHTRTIVDPDVAAKLTGKLGRTSFGLMAVADAAPGNYTDDELRDPALAPEIGRFAGRDALDAILRVRRDVGADSTIGAIFTSRDFVDDHNRVIAVDGRFRLDPKSTLTFQAAGTTTNARFYDPEANATDYASKAGFGYAWLYSRGDRHLTINASGFGRTDDYRAELGFTQRVATNHDSLVVRVGPEPKPDRNLIVWSLINQLTLDHDWRGRLQEWERATTASMTFRRQTYVNATFWNGYTRLFEEEFGPSRAAGGVGAFAGAPERSAASHGLEVEAGTVPSALLSATVGVSRSWGALDYDFGGGPRFPRVSPAALAGPTAGLDPGPGTEWDVHANLDLQPTKTWSASLDYTRSRLVRDDTRRVAFDEHIFELRTTYQFTRFAFARFRAGYDTLAANATGEALFGWTPNPGTAFYVGYDDDVNYNGYDPFAGRFDPGFRRNNRTVFVKVSYLIRKDL